MSDISHSCLLQAIVEHAEHMPDKIALYVMLKRLAINSLKIAFGWLLIILIL